MDLPQIRYARTSDGLNIAHLALGQGVPVVRVPNAPFDSAQLFASTWGRPNCEAFAEQVRFILYDGRGCGLSTRNVAEFSLETFMADLVAVADAAAPGQFVLHAEGALVAVALAYAARNPSRVSHLILHHGTARVADLWTRRSQSTHTMLTNATDLYVRAIAATLPGLDAQATEDYGSYMLHDLEPRVARRMLDAEFRLDVTPMLPDVRVPALVTWTPGSSGLVQESVSRLAAEIGADFIVIPSQPTSLEEFGTRYARAALRFLSDQRVISSENNVSPVVPPSQSPERDGGVRTILFTDIVGHTEMMQRLGDAKGRDVLREHERITRETLKQHGGTEVKTMGDGFMASFGSVTNALDCAIALQRAFANFALPSPLEGEGLGVRAGLNAGEPIEEDGDLFGATVILASRIAAKANAGEILIPEPVRHLLSGKSFTFTDRGEFAMKGFDDAVRLYEVRWRE